MGPNCTPSVCFSVPIASVLVVILLLFWLNVDVCGAFAVISNNVCNL
jgi:hypothetical protein